MGPWIILALSVICLSTVRGEDATSISIKKSNRQTPGSEVQIICKVAARWNTNQVFWWRRTGELCDKIGYDSLIESSFENGNRYRASGYGGEEGMGYSLTISDLRPEDSAEIGCSVRGVDDPATYVKLAVCEDIENQACLCIARTGFNSPNCYEKDPSIAAWESKYNSATAGLGVCLGIAVIYGIIMSVLVGWDCMARIAAKRKRQEELANMRKSHDPSMYAASEEVELNPHETSSEVDLAPTKPRHDKNHGYNHITTKAIAHTNRAYNPDDDTGYQEIDDTPDMPPQYNNYQSHSQPPNRNPHIQGAGAIPSPRPLNTYDASRYGPEVRSPGIPRTPNDGLYAAPQANQNDGRSPGAWSTHSANPAPGAFRYPESSQYGNGDISPRRAQPSPRNAYSERPPARNPDNRSNHLQPRQLNYTEGKSGPQQDNYQDDYDHYSANPGGAYMDQTGLSV